MALFDSCKVEGLVFEDRQWISTTKSVQCLKQPSHHLNWLQMAPDLQWSKGPSLTWQRNDGSSSTLSTCTLTTLATTSTQNLYFHNNLNLRLILISNIILDSLMKHKPVVSLVRILLRSSRCNNFPILFYIAFCLQAIYVLKCVPDLFASYNWRWTASIMIVIIWFISSDNGAFSFLSKLAAYGSIPSQVHWMVKTLD